MNRLFIKNLAKHGKPTLFPASDGLCEQAVSKQLPHEISWETLTEESGSKESLCEYTTVTRKIRRVARFDSKLVIDAITTNRPDVIILNHVDYFDMQQHGKPELSQRQLKKVAEISKSIGQQIDYVGNGPNTIFAVQKTT